MVATLAVAALSCSKEEEKPAAKPAQSAVPTAAPTPPPVVTPPVESAAPAPSAAAGPKIECPKGSSGEGTFNNPCEAKGASRLMEVAWTGKMDDANGPSFRVVNKSDLVILHGKVAVYFYDKAGKQLEVAASSSSPGKPRPYLSCSGKIFGGVMKAKEKATLTFSCVKKSLVPEGTTAIEAELQTVGIADATDDKKVDYYWRNTDLTPDERKKGGVKK